MLKVSNLHFSIGGRQILNGVSFDLKKGEIGTLIGASGSGKTTLFKLLTGLHSLHSGEVSIANHPVPFGYDQIACMMQEDLLLPWRTIMGNLTLLKELGKTTSSDSSLQAEAYSLLAEVGLAHCAHLYPHQLSAGMKQRVSLARALLQKRPILLLDEPFGSLDVSLREQMYDLLRQLRHKHGTTVLMVSHDFRDALSLSDRIFFLSKGKIEKEWTLSECDRASVEAQGKLLHEMRHALIGPSTKVSESYSYEVQEPQLAR